MSEFSLGLEKFDENMTYIIVNDGIKSAERFVDWLTMRVEIMEGLAQNIETLQRGQLVTRSFTDAAEILDDLEKDYRFAQAILSRATKKLAEARQEYLTR